MGDRLYEWFYLNLILMRAFYFGYNLLESKQFPTKQLVRSCFVISGASEML